MGLAKTAQCTEYRANPLVVSDRSRKQLQRFCETHKIAFEVETGTLAQSVDRIHELVARGGHTSVMLVGMPMCRWVLFSNRHRDKNTGTTDLPYMLGETGYLAQVCRLPANEQGAILHIRRMFKPVQPDEAPKITLLYGMPENIDPGIAEYAKEVIAQCPQHALPRILASAGLGSATGTYVFDGTAGGRYVCNQRVFDKLERDPSLLPVYLLGEIGNFIHHLHAMGMSAIAVSEIRTHGGDEIGSYVYAHFASSSLILTLSLSGVVHGSGAALVHTNGSSILTSEQIRGIPFTKSPFFWLGGCRSASPEMVAAVLRRGMLVGNSTLAFNPHTFPSSRINVLSPELDIIYLLLNSRTYGDAYATALRLYLADVGRTLQNSYPYGLRISLLCRQIELDGDIPENRPLIQLLNRSHFWGNCEVASAFYRERSD